MQDRLDYENLRDFLSTRYIGRRVIYLEATTSTNDIAKKLGMEGEKEGLVVVAEQQTSGRGRMGRSWSTHSGEAIAMTMLLKPDIPVNQGPSITPLLAISIVKALKDLIGIEVGIKWPNDIVLGSKKLCGILTEMSISNGKINCIIVGMGLNVNQESFEDEIKDIAISLRGFSGSYYKRKEILSSILNQFEINYEIFKKRGIGAFRDDLKKYSILMGKDIEICDIGENLKGKAIDIGEDGSLIVELFDGKKINVISGEVTIKGYYKCSK